MNEIHREALAGNTSRDRLITATRFSISDRDEFKRGREYPLLVVSGSVSRDAWIRCAPGDRRTLHHQAEILSHGTERKSQEDQRMLAALLRGSRGRVRPIARGSAEDRALHLSVRTATNGVVQREAERTNCLPMEITPARNRNFRRYPARRHLRRGTNCPIFFPSFLFSLTLLNYECQFARWYPLSLITRHLMRREWKIRDADESRRRIGDPSKTDRLSKYSSEIHRRAIINP